MWSSTNQRIKALMSARQREKDRLTRPIHVRRADIILSFRNDEGFLVEVPARALLNDFTPAGFSVYAVSRLTPNVELNVELDHPKHFRLVGKVVWCQYQSSSAHVLTPQTYPYRVGLAFIWKDAAIEEEFKKFCAELTDLYVNKKGLFIEENFVVATPPAAEAAAAEGAKDPNDVPPPPESDEGGAPTEEKIAAAPAEGAPAAETAPVVAATESPVAPAAAAAETPAAPPGETASVLDALKDVNPAVEEEKKAA
jgi:hypothetical protein